MRRLVLTGADEESYRAATTLSARAIPFPGGALRFITLSAWQWQVYDWLEARFGSATKGQTADEAHRWALNSCDDYTLRTARPHGWEHVLRIRFNGAARNEPVHAAVQRMRENTDGITQSTEVAFEAAVHANLCGIITAGMIPCMGLSLLKIANDLPDPFTDGRSH